MKVLTTFLTFLGFSYAMLFAPVVKHISAYAPASPEVITVDPWKLYTVRDNIKVYTRTNPNSPIKDVRITAELNTTMERLTNHLREISNYPDWVYKCKAANRIRTNHEDDYYYYTQTDMPFPFKDRDLVAHVIQWKDTEGVIRSEASAVADLVPIDEKMIRITQLQSNWTIFPAKNGLIPIDYTIQAHPGGSLPAWLINLAITRGPIKTMEKLMEKVQ